MSKQHKIWCINETGKKNERKCIWKNNFSAVVEYIVCLLCTSGQVERIFSVINRCAEGINNKKIENIVKGFLTTKIDTLPSCSENFDKIIKNKMFLRKYNKSDDWIRETVLYMIVVVVIVDSKKMCFISIYF